MLARKIRVEATQEEKETIFRKLLDLMKDVNEKKSLGIAFADMRALAVRMSEGDPHGHELDFGEAQKASAMKPSVRHALEVFREHLSEVADFD